MISSFGSTFKNFFASLRTWCLRIKKKISTNKAFIVPQGHPFKKAIEDLLDSGMGLFTKTLKSCLYRLQDDFPALEFNFSYLDIPIRAEKLKVNFLSPASPSATLVAIPLFLVHPRGNHFTIICIDLTHATIEYYDPIGEDPKIARFLKAIARRYFSTKQDVKILTNNRRIQRDAHNCGIFVVDYIERRAYGETFMSICCHGKSFAEIEAKRIHLAYQLLAERHQATA